MTQREKGTLNRESSLLSPSAVCSLRGAVQQRPPHVPVLVPRLTLVGSGSWQAGQGVDSDGQESGVRLPPCGAVLYARRSARIWLASWAQARRMAQHDQGRAQHAPANHSTHIRTQQHGALVQLSASVLGWGRKRKAKRRRVRKISLCLCACSVGHRTPPPVDESTTCCVCVGRVVRMQGCKNMEKRGGARDAKRCTDRRRTGRQPGDGVQAEYREKRMTERIKRDGRGGGMQRSARGGRVGVG